MEEFGVIVYDYIDIDYAVLHFKGVFRSVNGQHLLSWRDVTMKFEMVGTPLEVAQSVKKLDVSGHGVSVSSGVETPFIIFGMFFPDGNCGYMRIYTSTTTIAADGSFLEVPPKRVAPAKPDDVDSENTYHFNFQQSRGTAQALKLCVFSEQQLGTLRITHTSCPKYQKRIAEARSPAPDSPQFGFRPFATPASPHRSKGAHTNSGLDNHTPSMSSAHSPIKPCRLDNAFLSSDTTFGNTQAKSGKVTPEVRPRSVTGNKRSPLFSFLRPKSTRGDYKEVDADHEASTPLLSAMTGPEGAEAVAENMINDATRGYAADDGATPDIGLSRMPQYRLSKEGGVVEHGHSHSYAQYGASIDDIAFSHANENLDAIGTGMGVMGTGRVRRTSFAQYAISIEDIEQARDKCTDFHPYQLSLDGLSIADTKAHVSRENHDQEISPLFRGLAIPRAHTGKSPGMFGRKVDIPRKNIPVAKSMPLTAKTSPASPVKFALTGNVAPFSEDGIPNTGNPEGNLTIVRASDILTTNPSATPLYTAHSNRLTGVGVNMCISAGESGSICGSEVGFSHTSTGMNTCGTGSSTIAQLLRQAASLQVDIDEEIMFRDDGETPQSDIVANVPPNAPQCRGGRVTSTNVTNMFASSPPEMGISSKMSQNTHLPESKKKKEQGYRQYPLPPSPLKRHLITPTQPSALNVSQTSIIDEETSAPVDTLTTLKNISSANLTAFATCTRATSTHLLSKSLNIPTSPIAMGSITAAKPLPLLNIVTTPDSRELPPKITSPRFRHVTGDKKNLDLPPSVADVKYEESYPQQIFETPTPEAKDKVEVPVPTEVDKQHQLWFITAMKSAAVVGELTEYLGNACRNEDDEILERNHWKMGNISEDTNSLAVYSGRIPLQTQGSSLLNRDHVVGVSEKTQETPTTDLSLPHPTTDLPLPSQVTPNHPRTTSKRHLSPSCAALIQKNGFPVHIPVLKPQPTQRERFLSVAYAPIDSVILLKDYSGATSVRIATTDGKMKPSTVPTAIPDATTTTTAKSLSCAAYTATTGITATHVNASVGTTTVTANGANAVPLSIGQKMHQIGLSSTKCPIDLSRATSYAPAADLRNRYPHQQNIGNLHTFSNMNSDKNPQSAQNDKNIPQNNQNDENDYDQNYNRYQRNDNNKGYIPPTLNMNMGTTKSISTSTSMATHDKDGKGIVPSTTGTSTGVTAVAGAQSRKTTHTNNVYIQDKNDDAPIMDLDHFINAPAQRMPLKSTATNYTNANYEKTPQKSLKMYKNSDHMENVQLLANINTIFDESIKHNDCRSKLRETSLQSPLPIPSLSQTSTECGRPEKKRGFFSWFTSRKKNASTQY